MSTAAAVLPALTVEEVARLTGRNPEHIRRLVRQGRLAAVRDDLGVYRVPLDALPSLVGVRRSRG